MKTMFLSAVLTANLFAYTAEVKKESVTLQINDTLKTYGANQTIFLKGGDIICFVDGAGRVVIKGDDYNKQLSNRNLACKQLPIPANSSGQYIAAAKSKVAYLFADAKENSTNGVSRNGTVQENAAQEKFVLEKDKQFISIGSAQWGPLPVKLEIINSGGKILETFENLDEVSTSFIIPKEHVHEGDQLKVVNTFGDVLLDKKVAFR